MKKLGFLIAFLVPMTAVAATDASVRDNANRMFSECDSNSDGKISREEFQKEKMDKFTKYDKDNDGVLSKDEHAKMATDTHDRLMGSPAQR